MQLWGWLGKPDIWEAGHQEKRAGTPGTAKPTGGISDSGKFQLCS